MSSDFFEEVEQPAVAVLEADPTSKKVSYSQYSMFLKCPYSWKLSYIDKLKKYEDSIHTIFGTAMHEVLQEYVKILYTQGAPFADDYDAQGEFKAKFTNLFIEANAKGTKLGNDLLTEFLKDGSDILSWFTKPVNRMKYFPSKAYNIVGVELPLDIVIRKNLRYVGYLDVVLEDRVSKNIKILDFKTSTYGWKDYAKKDIGKTDQLLLYKKFYSDKFNVELDKIEIEFIILKRKLIEGYEFNQSRVSTFEPANGNGSIRKASERFDGFITAGFTKEGLHNVKHKFHKTPGKSKKNCKYCDFFKTSHCDSKED